MRIWYTNCITADFGRIHQSISRSILLLFVNKTPRYLNSSILRQNLSTTLVRAIHPSLDEKVLIGGVDFYPSCFKLSRKSVPVFTGDPGLRRPTRQHHLDFHWSPAMPRNSVHKDYEQNQWQRKALLKSSMHHEHVWYSAGNVNQAPAPVLQRLDGH